jgi:hypothetical protein
MKKQRIIYGLFFTFLLIGCNADDLSFDELKNLKIGEYNIQAPGNFNLIEQQGYDSKVGKIEGSGISMSFDYGMYTSPEQNIPEENYIIIDEINEGIRKQLVIAKNPQANNTSIHISFIGNSGNTTPPSLKFWTTNLTNSQQELVIKIYNSITIER